MRAAPKPLTADDVAGHLDVSRSLARWRLERLVDAGLVTIEFERRSGRSGPGAGRPAKTYAAAPETIAAEFPPRRYEGLVGPLVDALRARARRILPRRSGTLSDRRRVRGARLTGG